MKDFNNNIVINNIKTSMEMEKQFLNEQDINVLNNFADNKITMDNAIANFKNDAISAFKKITF